MNKRILITSVGFLVTTGIIVAILGSRPDNNAFITLDPLPPRVQTFEQMKAASGAGIYVEDQPAGAAEVVIGYAVMPAGGFIAIHADNGGVPGQMVGISSVYPQGGEHLVISVSPPLVEEEIYYAIVYTDPNEDPIKALSSGKARALTSNDDNVVMMSFAATASAVPETQPVEP